MNRKSFIKSLGAFLALPFLPALPTPIAPKLAFTVTPINVFSFGSEDELIRRLAEEVSKEIDNEIISMLLNNHTTNHE